MMTKLGSVGQNRPTMLLIPLLLLLCGCSLVTCALSDLDQVFLEAVAAGTQSLETLLNEKSDGSGLNKSCLDSSNSYGNLRGCLQSQQCVSADDVRGLYNVSPTNDGLEADDLEKMAPAILYGLFRSDSCTSVPDPETTHKAKPSPDAVWGYSFLFVTLINLCSLTGALVLPCMKMRVYKIILMFMVALAVGTLVGSGLLILIPEALGLPEEDESQLYIWKVTTVMGGIYLFFVVERVMRMVNAWRENKRSIKRNQSHVMGTFYHDPPQNPITKLKETSTLPVGETFNPCTLVHYTSEPIRHSNSAGSFDDFAPSSQQNLAKGETKTPEGGSAYTIETNGHVPQEPSPAPPPPTQVAPVAYMIVFGDALHNFIDGLSIGAAFSDNILLGVSVSVAVMCEELPHELGDFAILLNSGMRLRKAVLYNFLSSLSCYIGLIMGILLGENTSANTWIFAIAGGMFLYISLADMMPEMNSAAETDAGKEFGEKKTFLLQNIGLVLGFGIILLMAVYGGEIQFE